SRAGSGLENVENPAPKTKKENTLFPTLPQPLNRAKQVSLSPADLSNKPFMIDQYLPANQKTGDLVHRYYQEQMQIDGGKMDKFAAYSDAAGLVMGYYDTSKTELYGYAQKYTLADNFFHAAFGGSFLNHFWRVCARPPEFPNA